MTIKTQCPFCSNEFKGKDVYWILVPFNEITCRGCGRSYSIKWNVIMLARVAWAFTAMMLLIVISKLLFQFTEKTYFRIAEMIVAALVGVVIGFAVYKSVILRWLKTNIGQTK